MEDNRVFSARKWFARTAEGIRLFGTAKAKRDLVKSLREDMALPPEMVWQLVYDGQTEKAMNEEGYEISFYWLINPEDFKPITSKEEYDLLCFEYIIKLSTKK